jgi:glyoxylase-like metal-dependent hydrolase (beta-lactamase superfamily II)
VNALPVKRIVMPTPYGVGPVNAYLIDAEPLTLIDAGFQTQESQDILTREIGAAGHEVSEIGRVLITHGHPDHYGLVPWLQEQLGIDVYFPSQELSRMTGKGMRMHFGILLMRAGMPLELLMKMDERRKQDPRPWLNLEGLKRVNDGDIFEFEDFHLETHHLPGHSGGHFIYFEPDSRSLFAGDQLLPHVSPNPLLEPSMEDPSERRRSLEDYLDSLDRMKKMDPSIAYPGHGEPIADPVGLIDRTTGHHLERKKEVAKLLTAEGQSPYELAQELYPDVTGYDIYLSVSEVVAHLDLVEADGGAVIEDREGVTYYRATR